MKLLYVLPEYLPQEGGGLITFYRHLLPELVRAGHEVSVVAGSGVNTGEVDREIDGVRVRFLPEARLREARARFGAFAAVPELARHLAGARALWELADAGREFDLVETTDWGLLFVPWLAAAEGPPVVVQLHGSIGQIDARDPLRGQELQGLLARTIERAALAGGGSLQSSSRANCDEWTEATGRPVELIRPVWPASEASASEERTSDRAVVVARIQQWKGCEALCEAAAWLGSAAPAIDWVGRDTVDGRTGKSYSATLGRRYPDAWRRSIVPVGQRSAAEVGRMQRESAFAIVPSTWDVFNFTAVEAMAAGTPVVVSSGAGASELVEDGKSGFVFPAGDAQALAEAILRVTRLSAGERAALTNAARETIRGELAPGRIVPGRVARYEAILAEGAGRPRPLWLAELVAPPSRPGAELDFLHQLPLRGLLGHALGRLAGRIRP